MINHSSNNTNKKQKIDSSHRQVDLNRNTNNNSGTTNDIALSNNGCNSIAQLNTVTPSRSSLTQQHVFNPYRKPSLSSQIFISNTVTPIGKSIPPVQNPYLKKFTV